MWKGKRVRWRGMVLVQKISLTFLYLLSIWWVLCHTYIPTLMYTHIHPSCTHPSSCMHAHPHTTPLIMHACMHTLTHTLIHTHPLIHPSPSHTPLTLTHPLIRTHPLIHPSPSHTPLTLTHTLSYTPHPHTQYLGELEEEQRATMEDEETTPLLPLLCIPARVLFPGETLPMHLYNPHVSNSMSCLSHRGIARQGLAYEYMLRALRLIPGTTISLET